MSGTRTVNEVIMIGFIANDPILKESKNGQKLLVFNLATRRMWVTKDGESKEEVQYHKLVAWGRLADKGAKILIKGIKVYIRGYLHNRKIQVEGEEKIRIITEIILNDLLLLNRKVNSNGSENDNEIDNEIEIDNDNNENIVSLNTYINENI